MTRIVKKSFITLLIIISISLSVTACDGENSSSSQVDQVTQTNQSSQTSETDEGTVEFEQEFEVDENLGGEENGFKHEVEIN